MLIVLAAVALAPAPVPAARAPCPRRQLLAYVAHVGGGGANGADVFARPLEGEGTTWCRVGRLAAGSVDAADDSAAALARAAQRQHRLITEHACRIEPSLRVAKRGSGIELGVATAADGPVAAVPAADCWRA